MDNRHMDDFFTQFLHNLGFVKGKLLGRKVGNIIGQKRFVFKYFLKL